MKRCPHCKDNKVIKFEHNIDFCPKCKEHFPAVEEIEDACEMGCKHFHGGEIAHHPDCIFYPESRTKMYDDLAIEHKRFGHDIIKIIIEIQAEILKNVSAPNLGKKGCVTRLRQLLLDDYAREPEKSDFEKEFEDTIKELNKSYEDVANLRMAVDKLKGDLSDANQREYNLQLKSLLRKDTKAMMYKTLLECIGDPELDIVDDLPLDIRDWMEMIDKLINGVDKERAFGCFECTPENMDWKCKICKIWSDNETM